MGKGLIQLCFRVNGNRLNDWNIECNTGRKIHTLFSNSYKDLNRIRYKRNEKGKIILQSKNHFIDTVWLQNVLAVGDTNN